MSSHDLYSLCVSACVMITYLNILSPTKLSRRLKEYSANTFMSMCPTMPYAYA